MYRDAQCIVVCYQKNSCPISDPVDKRTYFFVQEGVIEGGLRFIEEDVVFVFRSREEMEEEIFCALSP